MGGEQRLNGAGNSKPVKQERGIQHVRIFSEDGMFGGWPANHGIWSWGNEILVGFVVARHEEKERGHTYNRDSAVHCFGRSLDGGLTWSIEEAYERGITAQAFNHNPEGSTEEPRESSGDIDFLHPDFALTFRRQNNSDGPSHFYYTYDRGRSWSGPFLFPDFDTEGIANRTDYIIEGKRELLVFLTAAKSDGCEGRVACCRTGDGGRSWEWVSWIGSEPEGYAIMPSSVRLSPSKLITVIRRKNEERAWLAGYVSEDNGHTWQEIEEPASDLGSGNPPAMIRLKDGRLCLAYGVRIPPSRICVRFSSDGGESWSQEIVVRGDDGANFDIGYPRMVQRPDGRVVLVYYYNHALTDGPPYRYIAATIFDPENLQAE